MIRQLYYLFLSNRSFVRPILTASAVVIPGWLAFRVYRHRSSGRPWSLRREILLLGFAVYLSALAAVTLSPNHNGGSRTGVAAEVDLRPSLASLTCSTAALPSGADRGFCTRNARGNVLLFLPLGILLPLVRRRLGFWGGARIALALSCGIELTQYLLGAWLNRSADVNDVVLNVAGACLGLALGLLLRLGLRTRA